MFRNVEKFETLNFVNKLYKEIYIIKFSKTNLCRIISQLKELEIEGEMVPVLFVRDFITKKSFDYYWGSFLFPQLKSGEWLNSNPIPDKEIESLNNSYQKRKMLTTL